MHASQACKFSTARVYQANLRRHIFPVIGELAPNAIGRAESRALIAACREKKLGKDGTKRLSRKSLENIARTVSSVLSQAVEDGLITANPAFRLGRYLRNGAEVRREIRPLTREECEVLLKAARQYAPDIYPLLLCALRTGLRLGELLALQWGDVDFNGRFIEVRRNLVAGRVTSPKSGKSRRVDMSTQLTTTLQAALTTRKALEHGWPEVPEWVFCNSQGGPLDGDNLRNRV